MRAIYFEKHGGPEVLEFGVLDDPCAGRGEVLIEVKATSLNHLDLFVRRGLPGIEIPLPHVPGCDASGVVADIGVGVTDFVVGDRVLVNPSLACGWCEYCIRGDASLCRSFGVIGEHRWGACAERLVVPQENVIKIPDTMSYDDAAAVPMVFVTAWRMLITRGELRASEDILIMGAAAGVGMACIQIAKISGARVFAAAGSAEKLELCRRLGADVLIDYRQEDVLQKIRRETSGRGVDVCVDYVGKDTWITSLRTLTKGGRLLTCGATTGYDPQTDLRHIFYRQLKVIGSTTGTRNDLLAALKLIFAGKMKPAIGQVFDLERTADAHRLMEARKVVGKVVIRLGDER
ncbi:MAG: zinc-binding dehydrogenase [Candidatus Krumholzibacteria bacterium]|nr:zinc-binding dehydrogenase [Candidatus Krumholzibacteria bacterium]